MQKPIIVTKVNCNQFDKLKDLATSVYAGMNSNPHFINPQPSMPVFKTCSDDLAEAMAKWGVKGNRGSHMDYLDLQLKAKTMHMCLTQLCAWCMSSLDAGLSYSAQAAILGTSGFPLKKERTPVGILQAVQEFSLFLIRNLGSGAVKLKWKKPLDVVTNTNVKNYNVYRNTTDNFSSASIIASIPNTTYIDNPGLGDWYYWVVPTNNAGNGITSHSLTVKIA